MTENLSQMVKEGQVNERVFSATDLDIPESDTIEEEELQAVEDDGNIEIVSLSEWFDGNVERFPNLRKPTVSIQGIDPNEQLIVVVVGTNSEGEEKCKLVVFDDAHTIPVVNLPAIDMRVYNNGFRIIYDLGDGVYMKSYGVRKGLITIACYDYNDMLIPIDASRVRKNDTEIVRPVIDPTISRQKLTEALDSESLQLRYKQSAKAEGLTTNLDAVKWLIERQTDIEDINHHLQIDNVIIDTLL